MCPQRLICATSALGSNGSRLIGHSVFNGHSMSANMWRDVSVIIKLHDIGNANEEVYVANDDGIVDDVNGCRLDISFLIRRVDTSP
jgi:hypothetical protein